MQRLLVALAAVFLFSAVAKGASIQFTQGGWSSGGTLEVAFEGDDLDSDGAIGQSELNGFFASWATPFGDTSTWGLSDIEPDGFLFVDLGNYVFFVRNPEFSLVNTALGGEVLASVFDEFLFPADNTSDPPSEVPEPAGLMGGGMAALSVALTIRARRRTRGESVR